jgi:hypothetical protein
VIAALCFVALAVAIGAQDLMRARRRNPPGAAEIG